MYRRSCIGYYFGFCGSHTAVQCRTRPGDCIDGRLRSLAHKLKGTVGNRDLKLGAHRGTVFDNHIQIAPHRGRLLGQHAVAIHHPSIDITIARAGHAGATAHLLFGHQEDVHLFPQFGRPTGQLEPDAHLLGRVMHPHFDERFPFPQPASRRALPWLKDWPGGQRCR